MPETKPPSVLSSLTESPALPLSLPLSLPLPLSLVEEVGVGRWVRMEEVGGGSVLVCGEALGVLREMRSESVDVVVTDPPFFRVKEEEWWDVAWETREEFLDWLDEVLCEVGRVLKSTGSVYVFCWPTVGADVEMRMRKHVRVLNRIAWVKRRGSFLRQKREALRRYAIAKEEIVFGESYRAYEMERGRLREIMRPILEWMREEREKMALSDKAILEAMGLSTRGSGMMAHYLGESQWALPSRARYEQLQALGRPYGAFEKSYDEVRGWYESKRRPFVLSDEQSRGRRVFQVGDRPHTDVWEFDVVAPGKDGKKRGDRRGEKRHVCEKPLAMMEHMILTSSREGDVILDPFSGSGVVGEAARKHGRRFVGVEIQPEWVEEGMRRMMATTALEGASALPLLRVGGMEENLSTSDLTMTQWKWIAKRALNLVRENR